MNDRSRSPFWRLGGLAGIVAVVAAVVLVPSALSVSTTRTFSAAVDNSPVAAGANAQTFNLTINNLGNQTLGSANISAPAGFAVTSVTGTGYVAGTTSPIQLRNVNLAGGSSMNVAVTADVPCTGGGGNWSITAKTQGDFGGQTFTLTGTTPSTSLTGSCTLVFTSQPNNALFNTAITSTAYNDPAGNAVTVEARNASNQKANAANDTVTVDKSAGIFTSTGNGFVNNVLALSGGSVSFPALQSGRTGIDLQLTATATGYTSSSASTAFAISVDGKKCTNTCNAHASSTHTVNTADGAGTNNTNLGVGLINFSALNPIPDGVCSTGPFQPIPGSDGFTEEIQKTDTATPDYTMTLDYDKFIVNQFPQNGVSAVQVCLLAKRIGADGRPLACESDLQGGFPTVNSPDPLHPFTAVCDPTTHAWGGLLPNVGPGINDCADSRVTNPAVLSRNRSGGSGNAHFVIKFCKPNPWDGMGGSH